MVVLSTLLLVHSQRHFLPAGFLSLSMIPMGTSALVSGAMSWVIKRSWWESLDNQLYRTYMRLCLFVFENVSGVEIVVSGDVDQLRAKKERAIILSNHQSNADWAVIFMLAARHSPEGALEALRVMVKHSIQYVPLFGWYIFQHGYIFVRRVSFSAAPVERQLHWLDTLSSAYWLLIFPEGTRIRPASLESSRRFREKKGLSPLERVLSPRSTGLQLSLDKLQSLEAVYDVTIAYSQKSPPGMFGFVCCRPGSRVFVDIRRHAIDEVRGRAAEFVEESFRRKEALLSDYASSGCLSSSSSPLPSIPLSETALPALLFSSALVAPFFLPPIRQSYLTTICLSPLLFAWLKINKCT